MWSEKRRKINFGAHSARVRHGEGMLCQQSSSLLQGTNQSWAETATPAVSAQTYTHKKSAALYTGRRVTKKDVSTTDPAPTFPHSLDIRLLLNG